MAIRSFITNRHDAGIEEMVVNEDPREEPKDNDFLFFSTCSDKMLLKGIKISLNIEYNPTQCKAALMDCLENKGIDVRNKDLIIYLAGGIPFLGGTLKDLYNSETAKVKRFIYGILIYPFSEDLNEEYNNELCNISDREHQRLIIPFWNPSQIYINDWVFGLCNMACLLSYLNKGGAKANKLLNTSAISIRFPPLITSMNRIIDNNFITRRDIITICATYHTYFTHLIALGQEPIIPPEKIFDYSLRFCNLITHVANIPEIIPMQVIEVDKDAEKQNFQYLTALNQPKIVYFWLGDTLNYSTKDFKYIFIKSFIPRAIEDANKGFISFTPIAPLSIRFVTGCSIVKGKEHCYLYKSQSFIKGIDSQNDIDIIDPLKGYVETVDIEKFAQSQENYLMDSVTSLIDHDSIRQVIFVCFDCSNSMNGALDNSDQLAPEGVPSRIVIATQYLISFANKIFAYRIPCILGLITFNDNIELRCPLSPLIPDFEDKGLKNIEASQMTALWDALSFACDKLNEYTTDESGKPKFAHAKKRIIVISDGEDTASTSIDFEGVTKKLLDNKIIVDTVFASTSDECDSLATLSHITDGLAIKPVDVDEGMSLFEQEAFLDWNERLQSNEPILPRNRTTIPRKMTSDKINEEFLNKAVKSVKYDREAQNKTTKRAKDNDKLQTAMKVCFINQHTSNTKPRQRRILRELHYAAIVMDKETDRYDPEIVIYPFKAQYDIWRLFLKASKDFYDDKWFSLLVTFPDNYPVEPPSIRFISVPYHLNVSKEGRICLEVLEKGYISSFHVIDIIQQIKILFITAAPETPIQIDILNTYLHDRDEYDRKARESAREVGKDSVADFTKDFTIDNEIGKDFHLVYDMKTDVPSYMKSQISGRVIKDPVVASTGVIYEKSELIQLLNSSKKPIDVVTGQILRDEFTNAKP